MTRQPDRLVLLGSSVSQSRSPRFQNAALRAAGIPLVYGTLDVEPAALPATMTALGRENAAGNVTIPHKEAMAALCARRSDVAERCHAVNTFWHEDGTLVGDNTDVGGFDVVARALMGTGSSSARVALLGAGGAAAAVLAAVEGWGGARATVYNRNMSRAQQLATRFPDVAHAASSLTEALDGATLVVNATPVGMRDDAFPLSIGELPTGAAVFDLVHRDGETAWVRAARAAGHRSADGRGMLIEQGALAFERWFGVIPDRDAMRAAMV